MANINSGVVSEAGVLEAFLVPFLHLRCQSEWGGHSRNCIGEERSESDKESFSESRFICYFGGNQQQRFSSTNQIGSHFYPFTYASEKGLIKVIKVIKIAMNLSQNHQVKETSTSWSNRLSRGGIVRPRLMTFPLVSESESHVGEVYLCSPLGISYSNRADW